MQIPIISEAPTIHTLKEQHFFGLYPHGLRDFLVWPIIRTVPLHLLEPLLTFRPAFDKLERARVVRVVEDIEEDTLGLVDAALPAGSESLEERLDVFGCHLDGDMEGQMGRLDCMRHGVVVNRKFEADRFLRL